VTFRWKEGGKRDVGLIAEQVNEVEPLLTNYGADGRVEGVKYDHLPVVLINGLQELAKKAERLDQENAALRDQLGLLMQRVEQLEGKRTASK
jgi:hypothetical protein